MTSARLLVELSGSRVLTQSRDRARWAERKEGFRQPRGRFSSPEGGS
jgi:hypothetical protein